MKTMMKRMILVLAGLAFLSPGNSNAQEGNDTQTFTPPCLLAQSSSTEQCLRLEEKEHLYYMREEEKLARDIYLVFKELYTIPAFGNISGSEQAHMNALAYLLSRFELEDPVSEAKAGEFKNPELHELYLEWAERGRTDVTEALRVAVLIEETDIADLQKALDNPSLNPDLQRVYSNLLRASKNHLRAFQRMLELRAESNAPCMLNSGKTENI